MCLEILFEKIFGLRPFGDKTKGLKSRRYHDGYEDLNWCAVTGGSVNQGSLCFGLTLTSRVRIL